MGSQLVACGEQRQVSRDKRQVSRDNCGNHSTLGLANTWETGALKPFTAAVNSDSSPCAGVASKDVNRSKEGDSDSESTSAVKSSRAVSPSVANAAETASSGDRTTGAPPRQVGPGVLTAGNFDNSLNLAVFQNFWNHQNQGMDSYDESFPTQALPSIDQVKPSTRFQTSPATAVDVALIIDSTGSMGAMSWPTSMLRLKAFNQPSRANIRTSSSAFLL